MSPSKGLRIATILFYPVDIVRYEICRRHFGGETCPVLPKPRAKPRGQSKREAHAQRELLAGNACGGLEAIHLRIMLGADAPVGGLAIQFFAGTVVKRAMRIDPHANARIAL